MQYLLNHASESLKSLDESQQEKIVEEIREDAFKLQHEINDLWESGNI